MENEIHYIFFATTMEQSLGGIARSVPRLAKSVAELGREVTLICPEPQFPTYSAGELFPVNVLSANSSTGVKHLLKKTLSDAKGRRVLYHVGIWSPWNHFVVKEARRRGVPIVGSPRSMLDPWALRYRSLKKWIAWRSYARRDIEFAIAIHATADIEAAYVKDLLGKNAPVFVAANGVDLPPNVEAAPKKQKRVLLISRLHPKKGIEDLIEAFGELAPDDWELVIAGNDDTGCLSNYKQLAAMKKNRQQIQFLGELTDLEKWPLYASADLFVLPSYSENFGIVVAEALGCGKPVLISNQVNIWREIEASGAGFVEDDTLEGCKRLLLSWSELANPDRTKMQDQAKLCFENNFRVESSVATILEILRNIKHAQ